MIGLISMKDVFEEMVTKELNDQDFHVPVYSIIVFKYLLYYYYIISQSKIPNHQPFRENNKNSKKNDKNEKMRKIYSILILHLYSLFRLIT